MADRDAAEPAVAPLASPETFDRARVDQIDSGPVDYVVRCTEGLFAGRFIYVNRTPQGELFGSDKACKDITMYIENADLSPRHAEIKFNDQTYQYFLRDAGSDDGTWVRIRWNRSIEIAPGQEIRIGRTLLRVSEGPPIPPEEEVSQWLASYPCARHLAPRLRSQGVTTLREALELAASSGDLGDGGLFEDLEPEARTVLIGALQEVDKMFPDGYPRHALELLVEDSGGASQRVCAVGWEGGTLCLSPDGTAPPQEDPTAPEDNNLGVVTVAGWCKCEWLRVGYSFGRYYAHLSEVSAESEQSGWIRLRTDQRHWLQPSDLFRIGTLEFQVLRFNAAAYSEQGFRATMEDEEILLQDLATSNWRHCSFFGVYDGHGGRECVTFVRQRLHMNFVAALHAKGGLDKSPQVYNDIWECLNTGFLETDRQFLSLAAREEGVNGGSGCAAVVVCLVGGWVWCANCGDSRALISREGVAVQLSVDHRPDREDEAARIESAGGFVSFRRVLGRLAVSRAFGDEEYKDVANGGARPLVIPDPEIRVERLTPRDEFMLLACDGLFDVFSSQEAVDFVRARLCAMPSNEQDPFRAVQDIVHEAIHERRSRDNVTAMLVTFKRSIQPHRGSS